MPTRPGSSSPFPKAPRAAMLAELLIPATAIALLATIASPHLTRAGDERLPLIASTTARLEDAISLYRTSTAAGRAYDPITDGWAPLVRTGYLANVPINPITGSSTIVRAASGCAGWVYDPASGRLDPCVIDPETSSPRPLERTRDGPGGPSRALN